MELIRLLGAFVLWAGVILAMLFLNGDQFRFSKRRTLILMGIVAIVLSFYEWSGENILVVSFLDGLSIALLCLLLTKGDLLGNLTVMSMYMNLINIIANLVIGGCYGLFSLLKGHATWMVVSDVGIGGGLLVLFSGAAAIPVSIWLVYRLKPTILSLMGGVRILVFLLSEWTRLTNNVLKDISGGLAEYQNDPKGIFLVLDSAQIMCFLLALAIVLISVYLEQRRTRKDMERQLETALREYGEITTLRQEIRELNHDMRNLRQGPEGQE